MSGGLFDGLPPAREPAPARAQASPTPCTRPFNGGYACRVGKGEGSLSDDGGRSHFCAQHTPKGFWPHERGRG
jgi:hypothetical protein